MELSEGMRKAAQILEEERARPTTSYAAESTPGDVTKGVLALLREQNLPVERQRRPRPVHESPDDFSFKSINYELLLALYSQIENVDREAFIAFLLSRVPAPSSARLGVIPRPFPLWNSYISELPLLAEFCVRVGYKPELFRAVGESQFTQGLVLLLLQLEETVAFSFNLFSDEELERMSATLKEVRARAYRKTYQSSRPRRSALPLVDNPEYDSTLAPVAKEIVAACDGIVEECRQARYWYLKGALQQNANLEVNQDKTRVEGYLKSLGFSGPLLEALNAAERDFRGSATPFELKNCLGHLRSFLEGLHEQACEAVAVKGGVVAPKRWRKSTEMLRNNTLLSTQEENLATSLYTLISDEGVHPLIAEREYARLLRNMVIEYGLMFLTKLEKAGIRLR